MITRDQIENILVAHGVKPTDDDEVIKSALIKANWRDDDVQTALVVLRENLHTHETHVDAVQNLFRGKAKLDAADINNLLGIEVDLSPGDISIKKGRRRMAISYGQIIEIALVSFAVSLIFLLGGMWYLEVGLFHKTML